MCGTSPDVEAEEEGQEEGGRSWWRRHGVMRSGKLQENNMIFMAVLHKPAHVIPHCCQPDLLGEGHL